MNKLLKFPIATLRRKGEEFGSRFIGSEQEDIFMVTRNGIFENAYLYYKNTRTGESSLSGGDYELGPVHFFNAIELLDFQAEELGLGDDEEFRKALNFISKKFNMAYVKDRGKNL